VAMQDVNGTNVWGGRTYVRDVGYTWLDDHGRIEHVGWGECRDDRITNVMRWYGHDGAVLLEEGRTLAASTVADEAWALDVAYRLTNPNGTPVTLGSPATNGRPGRAGYGGFFWRMAPGVPDVFDPASDAEEDVNGSASEWVAASGEVYTLIFTGLGEDDRWFVRAAEYPGVCVALAFERVRVIEPGASLDRRHRVIVADGRLTRDRAATLLAV